MAAGEILKLSELPRRIAAIVELVEDQTPNDAIARRLRELGFVNGERVEVMAAGPIAAEPLLVQVGFTRFALRRSEAARVRVITDHGGTEVSA
jgi:ferrous iron transport protein A